MAEHLPTYTQRVARIAAILEPFLHVSRNMLLTRDVNPAEAINGLACRWFDRQDGRAKVGVYIDQLPDLGEGLAALRAEVIGEDYYEPGSSSELDGLDAEEYAFVQHYADSVTVIVGNCRVSIHPAEDYQGLSELVEPALEIGRSVGCSAYGNDYIPPPIPQHWQDVRWGVDLGG